MAAAPPLRRPVVGMMPEHAMPAWHGGANVIWSTKEGPSESKYSKAATLLAG